MRGVTDEGEVGSTVLEEEAEGGMEEVAEGEYVVTIDGLMVGESDSTADGVVVGKELGVFVGTYDGEADGTAVGAEDGV